MIPGFFSQLFCFKNMIFFFFFSFLAVCVSDVTALVFLLKIQNKYFYSTVLQVLSQFLCNAAPFHTADHRVHFCSLQQTVYKTVFIQECVL